MAIIQGICNTFKEELLDGVHNFNTGGDSFYIALYTSSANIGPDTTQWTASGEPSTVGTGYTSGGKLLTGQITSRTGSVSFVDFADASWTSSTFSGANAVEGALIYNQSKSNKAVMVLNFGSARTSSNSTFSILFPSADATNAILRLS